MRTPDWGTDGDSNRRSNVLVRIGDEEMNLKRASDVYNVHYSAIWQRYQKGIRGMDLIKGLRPKN